jgi:hypothetical protein
MSRKSWNNGLVDALEQIGVIDDAAARAIVAAKESYPDEATGDLIVRLGYATEDDVQRAIVAQTTGDLNVSSDLIVNGMQKARSRLASVARASVSLGAVAASILDRKS